MKELSKYNIDIYGLEDKRYDYDMESGDAFFEEFDQDLVERGRIKTHIILNKTSTMMTLDFQIEGQLELTCDRSLESYEESFSSEQRMILKFGDRDEELSEEIELINRNTNRINVAKYIFEFIALALPVKKIHPKYRKDDDDDLFSQDDEEAVLVYSSEKPKQADESNEEEVVDPRWEALKKLKGL